MLLALLLFLDATFPSTASTSPTDDATRPPAPPNGTSWSSYSQVGDQPPPLGWRHPRRPRLFQNVSAYRPIRMHFEYGLTELPVVILSLPLISVSMLNSTV